MLFHFQGFKQGFILGSTSIYIPQIWKVNFVACIILSFTFMQVHTNISLFNLLKFTYEKITGEALVAIEKSDLKELGVQPMGRRIALIAKISELINTPKQDKHPDVVKKSENVRVMKKKITVEDKKLWDAKSKTAYLEK